MAKTTTLRARRESGGRSLQGKRVLITGASSGIGAGIARLFAEAGAVVGIHYHESAEQARALQRELRSQGAQAECFRANLARSASLSGLIARVVARLGGMDVLVSNAGAMVSTKHFRDVSSMDWDRVFALNAKAHFFIAREALLHMQAVGAGGRIIAISSVSVKYGGSERSLPYAAAKAALETAMHGLAKAGAHANVLVNVVRAGFIDTAFHHKTSRPDFSERISLIPLRRPGQVVDVARMVLYLAGEGGDFITGQILTVSGGD